MANEFKHADVGGGLTEAEYDSVTGHQFASQATGDIMYASSSSQLSRLGVGATGAVLTVTGGVPVWDTTWTPTGHVIPGTDGAYDLGSSALGFNDLHLGSGGIINLDGGDVTLTHSAGTLTYGGDGAVSVAFGANVDLQFTGGTGTNEIVLANGLADALSITDGSADVIAISTAGGTNTVAITGDLTVSGTIAADTAAVATAVTITDNESTDEANAIIFTSGGDVDGGDIQLESDGTLNYNPSTGTLTSTVFAGNLTGNASGTAATVTGGTQASITAAANLITVGTIGTGVWEATDVAVAHGGTGASSATAGFDALSPMTAEGDILYGGSSGTVTRLAKGDNDQVLTLASGVPSWAAASGGSMTSFQLEDDSGDEVAISNAKEVKFIGDGLTINWTDTDNGTDGDPYDLTFTVDASQTQITHVGALEAGTISSTFGNIDNGSSTLDTGALTATTINGVGTATIDGDLTFTGAQSITTSSGNLTITPGGGQTIIQAARTNNMLALTNTTDSQSMLLYADTATTFSWYYGDEAITVDSSQNVRIPNGNFFIGDTTHGQMTQGLVINQAGNDNLIFALKSDQNTVLDDLPEGAIVAGKRVEADDFFTISKVSDTHGGATMQFLAAPSIATPANFIAYGGSGDNTKSTSGVGAFNFYASSHLNDAAVNMAANANLMAVSARVGGANVTRWILDEDGDTWQTGDVVMGTAGKGIDFSANTGAAGEASAILDWYEEGTWTPLIQDSSLGSVTDQTYSVQVGRYTRIGRTVWIKGAVVITGHGSMDTSNGANLAGLPFTSENLGNGEGTIHFGFVGGTGLGAGVGVQAVIANNTTYANLYAMDASGGNTNMLVSEVATGTRLHFTGMYQV